MRAEVYKKPIVCNNSKKIHHEESLLIVILSPTHMNMYACLRVNKNIKILFKECLVDAVATKRGVKKHM